MNLALVAGATGQLGFAAVKGLLARGIRVRALVRQPAAVHRFTNLGADAVIGDLTDAGSLQAACDGVTTVVATANSAVPARAADSFAAVERHGYRNLLAASAKAGVERFVYTSALPLKDGAGSEFLRLKHETEERVAACSMSPVIFRAGVFMDVAFAMMGSSLPLRGADFPTVLRPFSFSFNHFQKIRNSIEDKRTALIPGDGTVRHTFICVDDVARFLVAAAEGGPNGIHNLGGPEALTYLDVVRIFEKVLNHPLKVKPTPAFVFRILSSVLRPFNPAGSNLMYLNYIGATTETVADSAAAAAFGVPLTSAETFLRSKITLPPAS